MDEKRTNFALLAIVAIVAIVALVVLLKAHAGPVDAAVTNSVGQASTSSGTVGQASAAKNSSGHQSSFAYVLWTD